MARKPHKSSTEIRKLKARIIRYIFEGISPDGTLNDNKWPGVHLGKR